MSRDIEVDLEAEYLQPRCSINCPDVPLVRTAILCALKDQLPLFTGTLLDVGCGYMPYKSLVLNPPSRATQYLGLDLEDNPAYENNPDLLWDGRSIPLPDDFVECAMLTEVLEHCPEPEIVLNEVRRVLKPSGLIFFTVPFLFPLHDEPHDEYRYTPFALRRHLRNSGFERISLKPLGGWDASLAQMIALWVRRRPMSRRKHALVSRFALPVILFLAARDRKLVDFEGGLMFTGIAGSATKPG